MSSCAGKLPIVSEECPSLPRCGKTQKVLGLPHRVYTTFRAACFSRTRQGNWSHCRFKGSHAPLCVCASACHRPDRPRLVLSEIGIDPTQQMLCHAAFLWCSCFVVQLFCGAAVLWYSCFVVQLFCGTAVLWYSCFVVQMFCGAAVLWCSCFVVYHGGLECVLEYVQHGKSDSDTDTRSHMQGYDKGPTSCLITMQRRLARRHRVLRRSTSLS